MAELTKEQLEEGKKVLGGINIFFWVVGGIIAVGLFSFSSFGGWAKDLTLGPIAIGLPTPSTAWLLIALYVIALVGLYIRKGWAVPVGRAGLVVAMVIFFPVGTIFGAILWKRINDPAAKRYLNYGEGHDETAEEKPAEEKPVKTAEGSEEAKQLEDKTGEKQAEETIEQKLAAAEKKLEEMEKKLEEAEKKLEGKG